jgi:hypothetical protein
MNAARARRLRPTNQTEILQCGFDDPGNLAHVRPGDAWYWIEIDPQLVGMIEIVGANGMRVKLEAREVRHPRKRRGVPGDDLFGSTS